MADYRAEFDAEVTFLNGGGLQAQGFRLDIPGPDVSEPELAAAFVRQLGLLMTDQVRLSAVRILQEPHKGLRGRPEPATAGRRGRMVELSHVVTAGMVTYPGLPGPEITQHLTREESRAHYAPGSEFESAGSRLSATPAPTWTAPTTATQRAPTWPGCRWTRWPTCPRWSSA
jgi:hypothetical protein